MRMKREKIEEEERERVRLEEEERRLAAKRYVSLLGCLMPRLIFRKAEEEELSPGRSKNGMFVIYGDDGADDQPVKMD